MKRKSFLQTALASLVALPSTLSAGRIQQPVTENNLEPFEALRRAFDSLDLQIDDDLGKKEIGKYSKILKACKIVGRLTKCPSVVVCMVDAVFTLVDGEKPYIEKIDVYIEDKATSRAPYLISLKRQDRSSTVTFQGQTLESYPYTLELRQDSIIRGIKGELYLQLLAEFNRLVDHRHLA